MSSFVPRDPAWHDRCTTAFASQGLMAHLGVELAEVTPGRCLMRLPFRPQVGQHHGFFHGGVIGTLADNAGGFAGLSLLEPAEEILTVEYKLNILAPGKGAVLGAEGHVVKRGRSLIIARIDLWVSEAADGAPRHLCAIAQQTLMPLIPAA